MPKATELSTCFFFLVLMEDHRELKPLSVIRCQSNAALRQITEQQKHERQRAEQKRNPVQAVVLIFRDPDASPKALSDHWTVAAMLQITQQKRANQRLRRQQAKAKTQRNQQPQIWLSSADARPKTMRLLSADSHPDWKNLSPT